jgi:hypothetical protein
MLKVLPAKLSTQSKTIFGEHARHMAIIDNLQKISDMVWELPSQLQGRYARAGVDHAQSLAALFLIW